MTDSILNQFRLDGQVAVVVGGNRGLGFEISKALAEAGANVAIVGRDVERNEGARNYLQRHYGQQNMWQTCDICDEHQIDRVIAVVTKQWNRIDVLVNSAGVNIRGTLESLSLEQFEQVQRVNVTGTWSMCRAVVPIMKQQGYGRIVNMASMLSIIGMPERTPYATSKGAVLQLTRALALELASHKINVNAILPGPFATEMNLPLTNDPEKYAAFVAKIPLGRWGELHELGALALYLCSPACSYVTGAAFSIDGGWTAQ